MRKFNIIVEENELPNQQRGIERGIREENFIKLENDIGAQHF